MAKNKKTEKITQVTWFLTYGRREQRSTMTLKKLNKYLQKSDF